MCVCVCWFQEIIFRLHLHLSFSISNIRWLRPLKLHTYAVYVLCVHARAHVLFKQLNFWTMLNLKIIYRIKNNYVIINWFKDIRWMQTVFRVWIGECMHSPIMSLCERNRVWYTWKLFLMKWCTYLLWCIIAITAHLCKYRIRDVAALFNRHTHTHSRKKIDTTVNCLG